LGYIGLGVTDLPQWRSFTRCLGIELAHSDEPSETWGRIDERSHRIWMVESEVDSLLVVGWEASSPESLDMIVEAARRWGSEVTECEASYAARRHYDRVVRLRDPAGMLIEVACTPVEGPTQFQPTRPMSGFKAGANGLGHLFVYAPDLEAVVDFYVRVLGFQTSDFISWPEAGIEAVFLRCNSRHHSIAFAKGSGPAGSLEHMMLETLRVDDVGTAIDTLLAAGFSLATSLGRHINDNMFSFYARTPSGFWLEYGCDAIEIAADAQWEVKRYTNGHTWGHAIIDSARPALLPFPSGGGHE